MPRNLDVIDPIAAGDQANELIVTGPRQDGKPRALQRLNTITGKLGEILWQDKEYDLTPCSVYRHPKTGIIIGLRYSRGWLQTVWFDDNYRTVQKIIEDNLPGQVIQILGSDNDEIHFFVSAYSDCQPPVYYSLDLKTRSLRLIKNTAPWIEAKRMAKMRVMKFKTRDGHLLDAYVTLPEGASKQTPAPLVVLPHGGPWHRDSWGFDREAQFLASRGYAVLQPNYRGSLGYHWAFPAEDTWAFLKMHEDVTDAVKALVGTGLVDPRRMAIMGSSFGGYLALCGAAFEPKLYRCAITIAGVFDWGQVLKEKKRDQHDNAAFGIFSRNLGDPGQQGEKFAAISPLRHTDQIRIPLFVAHGTDDPVADVNESRHLISELEKHGVAHEVLLIHGEGHGMGYVKNQVALYAGIEAFLAKNLQPVPLAAAASAP